MLKDAICFDDVLLEPKFSDISSRKEIVLESPLCDNILLLHWFGIILDEIFFAI